MFRYSLIIAGYGSMGRAFVRLYKDYLQTFKSVYVFDLVTPEEIENDVIFHRLDVTNAVMLRFVLAEIDGPVLFLNLTAGTDTVIIRNVLKDFDAIYIDTACSTINDSSEYKYSSLMPYTYTDVGNQYPHLLCCGLNPGIVEILIRKLIKDDFSNFNEIDVILFERDTLTSQNESETCLPVSWSPATLIDEVLLSPTIEIIDGQLMEGRSGPTELVTVNWFSQKIQARLVGHEEIWNMQYMEDIKVRNCAYAYAFSDKVMDALEKGVSAVRHVLYVPDMSEQIRGEDHLAIKIIDTNSGKSKMIAWHLDHAKIWKKHRVNAVQFQVCASIRLFCEITASEHFKLNRSHCAANIPINDTAWNAFENMMKQLDIHWKEIPANSIEMEGAPLNCRYE